MNRIPETAAKCHDKRGTGPLEILPVHAFVHEQHRHKSKKGGGGKSSIDTKICTSYIILYYYIIIRIRKLCTTKNETNMNLYSNEKVLYFLDVYFI